MFLKNSELFSTSIDRMMYFKDRVLKFKKPHCKAFEVLDYIQSPTAALPLSLD